MGLGRLNGLLAKWRSAFSQSGDDPDAHIEEVEDGQIVSVETLPAGERERASPPPPPPARAAGTPRLRVLRGGA